MKVGQKISRKIGKWILPVFAILFFFVAGVNLFAKNVSATQTCDASNSCSKSDTDKACSNLNGSNQTSKGYGCAVPKSGSKVSVSTCKSAGGHPVDTNDSKFALCEFYLSDFNNNYTTLFKKLNSLTSQANNDGSTLGVIDTTKLQGTCKDIVASGKTVGSGAVWVGDVGGGNFECDVPASISDALKTAADCTKLGGTPNNVAHPDAKYSTCQFVSSAGDLQSKLNSLSTALNQFDQQTQDIAKKQADTSSKCALTNGLGFIICPAMWLLSSAIDGVYKILSPILAIPVDLFTNPAVKAAWSTFITYANILLAIIFLVIIYSEATGNGFGAMNNYNIKKTLPQLIIFAVLINVSFWICAAAVDVSNIVGSGIYGLFTNGKDPNSFSSQFKDETDKATSNASYGQ